MSDPASAPVLRHPRRLGFILFNLLVLVAAIAWLTAPRDATIGDLPNVALANTGMLLLLLAWIVSWVAWAVLVWRRRQRQRARP